MSTHYDSYYSDDDAPQTQPPVDPHDGDTRWGVILLVMAIVLLLLAIAANSQTLHAQSTTTPTKSTPTGVKEPDPKWLEEYDNFIKRNTVLSEQQQKNQAELQKLVQPKADEMQKKLQPEVDYLSGLSRRLVSEIPEGYQFDKDLRVFVPIPKPAPPTETESDGK